MDYSLQMISYIIIAFLIIIFFINLLNQITIKKVNIIQKATSKQPYVSILIPARNESGNILNCVNSCLRQDYPYFEIIVLDDNSEDNTFETISAVRDLKLKVIKGKPLEEGWVGKSFACHQLQQKAKGEYLLFLDADTNLKPDGLRSSVEFALKEKAGLLSLMPEEFALTFWEKVSIPMLHFTIMTMVPLILVEKTKKPSLTVSNGQFMLFKKNVYEEIGGHFSVRNNIVDDIWLGRKVKAVGYKLIFADGTDIASCRMYKNLNEIIKGFSKNLFPGLSFSLLLLSFVIILYFSVYIFPLLVLIYSLIALNFELLIISIAAILTPVLIRISHSLKFNLPSFASFLNFIGASLIIILGINSFRLIKHGRGADWKGREYDYKKLKD
ncbi:MAG: glycosyltransferase [Ignavibacteria bacterium]|nr:glycosyltransferase [Ignavibacteria bacterium]